MSKTKPAPSADMVSVAKVHTLCRMCHLSCSLVVDMVDGKPVQVRGDKDNPIFQGFSCIRGRQLGQYGTLPSRLKHSLARNAAGELQPVSVDQAVEEIATKLKNIIDEHGPRSVAIYNGTWGMMNNATTVFAMAFIEAIGSPMLFTPESIDQPGKAIAAALHGRWLGGVQRNADGYDVMLLIGSNPPVSGGGPFGLAPAITLPKVMKEGNTKLIVCDPRQTETAKHADIHLQVRPGQDAAVLAGIIHVILEEGLGDPAFVAENAQGLDELRAAVAPFNPETVASQAGISAEHLRTTARLYGTASRGLVHVGTGPNMNGWGTLNEYLGRVLTTLCGHWPRAGERLGNPGVLVKIPDAIAATMGPTPANGFGEKVRVHGLSMAASGMPTAALSDEILLPGEGQVRALLSIGGNPMGAFPDQEKTFAALKNLDLLISFDPRLSPTSRLADYVIAPTIQEETPGVTGVWDMGLWGGASIYGFDIPYHQYSPPLVPLPAGYDVIDEWRFLYRVANKMGMKLNVRSYATMLCDPSDQEVTEVDMNREMSTEEVLEYAYKGSPLPLAEVKQLASAGHVFDMPEKRIGPKPPGWEGRFDIGNVDMMQQLRDITSENKTSEDSVGSADSYPYRMISRRMKDVFNSNWNEYKPLQRKWGYNPAFMNPQDMQTLGVSTGDQIRITSAVSSVLAIVEAEPELRRGCVSIAHGWGPNPDEPEDPKNLGSCSSRLVSNSDQVDPWSGIPRMSAVPVAIQRESENHPKGSS